MKPKMSKILASIKGRLMQLSTLQKRMLAVFIVLFVVGLVGVLYEVGHRISERRASVKQQEELGEIIDAADTEMPEEVLAEYVETAILPKYEELYSMNSDMIGWLKIEDTIIDYPVMQTMWDENYYLDKNFYKEKDSAGCLLMDTDSQVGIGKKTNSYGVILDGTNQVVKPSTNLIIHGHTKKNGTMFGKLTEYADEEYAKAHSIIKFDSLYEEREYEVIAVFYSQVYLVTDEVFKYYKFFEANTQEEFDDWYTNIKKLSEFDTGVTAEFGDEFITLSCCAYHVEDGRFVVVGKRIK